VATLLLAFPHAVLAFDFSITRDVADLVVAPALLPVSDPCSSQCLRTSAVQSARALDFLHGARWFSIHLDLWSAGALACGTHVHLDARCSQRLRASAVSFDLPTARDLSDHVAQALLPVSDPWHSLRAPQ